MICKGRKTKIDLTELDLEYNQNLPENEKKVYMVLSLTWAIIADVDINSEAIRCVGSPRFTLWAIYRALFERSYGGSLKFHGM